MGWAPQPGDDVRHIHRILMHALTLAWAFALPVQAWVWWRRRR